MLRSECVNKHTVFQIVILNNLKPITKHPNIKEINHGVDIINEDGLNMFEVRKNKTSGGGGGGGSRFKEWLTTIAREMYDKDVVKNLYSKRHEFDLIMIDSMFNEVNNN